jgi:hypothetical protein
MRKGSFCSFTAHFGNFEGTFLLQTINPPSSDPDKTKNGGFCIVQGIKYPTTILVVSYV